MECISFAEDKQGVYCLSFVVFFLLNIIFRWTKSSKTKPNIKWLGSLLAVDRCEIIPQRQREIWPALLSWANVRPLLSWALQISLTGKIRGHRPHIRLKRYMACAPQLSKRQAAPKFSTKNKPNRQNTCPPATHSPINNRPLFSWALQQSLTGKSTRPRPHKAYEARAMKKASTRDGEASNTNWRQSIEVRAAKQNAAAFTIKPNINKAKGV